MSEPFDATKKWRRSTYCADGACVEIAEAGEATLMRDSKNPDQPPLAIDSTAWAAFIQGIENGEFKPL